MTFKRAFKLALNKKGKKIFIGILCGAILSFPMTDAIYDRIFILPQFIVFFCITAFYFLWIYIFMFVACFQQREVMNFFEKKGYCYDYGCLYRQKNIYDKPNPHPVQYLVCGGIFTTVNAFPDALAMYNSINPYTLNDKLKFCYYNDITVFNIKTGNTDIAMRIITDNIGLMQRQALKERVFFLSYSCLMSLIYAQTGDYSRALSYLLPAKPKNYKEIQYIEIYLMYVYIYAKMNNRDELETSIKYTKEFLNGIDGFLYKWQKDFFIAKLDKMSQGILC